METVIGIALVGLACLVSIIMKLYYWSLIFLHLCLKSTAINRGYRDCLLGTGQQSPLLLQDGLRCVQVQNEKNDTWDDAMDLCNSKQGHLFHVYTSDEAKLVVAWILERPLSTDPYNGQKKIGPLNGKFTGFNVKWFTTKTEHIGMEQSYQYYQYNLWGVGNTNNDAYQHGITWAQSPAAHNRGYGTFGPQRARHLICQFLSDNPPKTQFKGLRGKRSLAPVYVSLEEKHSMSCGNTCMRHPWCMGFNSIGNGNGVICEMIAVKQSDTVAGIVEDDDTTYYQRNKG